jgi:hypothetical protein
MPVINPDPHRDRYVFEPSHLVTAKFPGQVDLGAFGSAFTGAGFAREQVHVFQGQEGANELDLAGKRHGRWVQFRRKLESVFLTHEAWVFEQAEETLRSGGVVVVVTTGPDDARKDQAAEILKSLGGQGVRYWGPKSMQIFF